MRSRSKAVLLALWIGGALAASVGAVVLAAVEGSRAGEPVADAPSPNDAVFTIGQWEFRIPSAYVGMAGKDGALLNAVGPDFKPKSGPSKAGWGDDFLMLVEPKPALATLQSWLAVDLDFIKPYHAVEKQYGLERFVPDHANGKGMLTNNDAFIDKDSAGNIQTVLYCDLPGTVQLPGCEETYLLDSAIISVDFSRDYLPLWQSVKNNFLSFLYDHGKRKQ